MGEAIAEQLQDQAAQIIRLRSELAVARRALLAGNDTVLANKKLQEDNAAKDARIAELEIERDRLISRGHDISEDRDEHKARAERAEARVAEFGEGKAGWEVEGFIDRLARRDDSNSARLVLEAISHLRGFSRDCDALRARAERAEAERDALYLFSGAQATVIKEMREALELVDADVRHHLRSDAIDHALLRKHAVAAARAALAPSPAGSASPLSWRCADCGAEPPITCTDRTCCHYSPPPAGREG